jgi:prepilin-type N-terminal cleavage/methylation domain-containing protein
MKDLIRMARARALDAETEIEGTEAADAGFTLIELMVVLLIIAILLAIAIPTFLGVSNTASDRAAQSNLTNAVHESAALFQVNDAFSGTSGAYTSGSFTAQAPEFDWAVSNTPGTGVPCLTSQANCISALVFNVVTPNDAQGLSLAVDSVKTNTCWYAFDLESTPGTPVGTDFANGGVYYGKATTIPAGGCVALNPNTDTTGITFGPNTGQSYSTAVAVS